jgi:hypothetical protein
MAFPLSASPALKVKRIFAPEDRGLLTGILLSIGFMPR